MKSKTPKPRSPTSKYRFSRCCDGSRPADARRGRGDAPSGTCRRSGRSASTRIEVLKRRPSGGVERLGVAEIEPDLEALAAVEEGLHVRGSRHLALEEVVPPLSDPPSSQCRGEERRQGQLRVDDEPRSCSNGLLKHADQSRHDVALGLLGLDAPDLDDGQDERAIHGTSLEWNVWAGVLVVSRHWCRPSPRPPHSSKKKLSPQVSGSG